MPLWCLLSYGVGCLLLGMAVGAQTLADKSPRIYFPPPPVPAIIFMYYTPAVIYHDQGSGDNSGCIPGHLPLPSPEVYERQ